MRRLLRLGNKSPQQYDKVFARLPEIKTSGDLKYISTPDLWVLYDLYHALKYYIGCSLVLDIINERGKI